MDRPHMLAPHQVQSITRDLLPQKYLIDEDGTIEELFEQIAAALAQQDQEEFTAEMWRATIDYAQLVRLCGGRRVEALNVLGLLAWRILQTMAGMRAPCASRLLSRRPVPAQVEPARCRKLAPSRPAAASCSRGFFSASKTNLRNAP